MERNVRYLAEPVDGRAGHSPPRLDPQKKTLGAAERDEQARAAYRARVAERAVDDFVIVDETGSNIHLTPRYARAPRGTRAHGRVPYNIEQNTTLIASLTTAGMGPAMLLDGATDSAACAVYIERFLVPSLRPGQVVVLDNLSAHKNPQVQALIEAAGCALWYLPAYSPDLSPIEEAFAKLKQLLRRAAARTRDALHTAIATAIDHITAQDADGFFGHCGYGKQVQ